LDDKGTWSFLEEKIQKRKELAKKHTVWGGVQVVLRGE